MAKPVTGLTVFQNNLVNSLVNLDNNFTLLANAINDPGSYSNYWADTGSVNALVAAYTNFSIPSLQDGQIYTIKVANTTTSANPTLKIANFSAAIIYKRDGGTLNIGELVQNQIYLFIYNSSLAGFNLLGSNQSNIVQLGAVTGSTPGSTYYTYGNPSLSGVPNNAGSPLNIFGTNVGGVMEFSVMNTDFSNNAQVEIELGLGGTQFSNNGFNRLRMLSINNSGVVFNRLGGWGILELSSGNNGSVGPLNFSGNGGIFGGGSVHWSISSAATVAGVLTNPASTQPGWGFTTPATRSTNGIVNYQTNVSLQGNTMSSGTVTIGNGYTGLYLVMASCEVGYNGGVGGANATLEIFHNGSGTGYKATWTENNNTTEHGVISVMGLVLCSAGTDTIGIQFSTSLNGNAFTTGCFVGRLLG